jgi:carboxymethylenebutenolidase
MLRFALSALLLSTTLALAAEPSKIAPSADTVAEALKNSPRHGEWVDILVGDVKLHSWVVYPERKDKAPVVLVIHEIFGLTDWVRGVADQLAAEGFIAVAPDLLSGKGPKGGGTESFKDSEVRAAIQKLTPEEVATRLDAAREWALQQPSASGKSASIGFCWGGAASFNYATHQPKLNAAAVYYGSPPKKDLDKIECPVLGCYGGSDNRITSTVEATKKSMEEAKKSYSPHVYDGAGHGFLRQQSGQNGANQKAADEAWKETIAFFKKNLE